MISLDARLAALSSPVLLAALERTAAQGREVTADLIALLAECDARQLYAAEGYPSLFEFCIARLRLSEAQAYHRIQAARAVRRFPLVLERLREGRVTLTAVALLREHLTESTHREMLDWAEGRSKREVEGFIRRLDPKPDVRLSLRRLAPPSAVSLQAVAPERQAPARVRNEDPTALLDMPSGTATALPLTGARSIAVSAVSGSPGSSQGATLAVGNAVPEGVPRLPAPVSRNEIRPLAPARYSLHVTISEETHDKLRRAQDLLRQAVPSGDPAVILDRALTFFVAHLERRRFAAATGPSRSAERRSRCSKPLNARPDRRDARPTPVVPCLSPKPQPRSDAAVSPAPPSAPLPEVGAAVEAARAGAAAVLTAAKGASRQGPARPPSRYIPASVRRAVWLREGGRCSYVSSSGVRCTATARLEYHHRVPFADGGPSTVENLVLRCRRHNALEAERWFNFDRTEFFGAADHRGASETPD